MEILFQRTLFYEELKLQACFLMEHKISQIEYLFLEMNFAPYYEAAYK